MFGITISKEFIPVDASKVIDAHLCNVCNTLYCKYGRSARLFTSYDSALISLLTYSQAGKKLYHLKKGCFNKGYDTIYPPADDFASGISIYLAYLKLRDDLHDDKSITNHFKFGFIKKKAEIAINTLEELEFPAREISKLIDYQKKLEDSKSSLLECMEPTETATAKVFAHTAILSNQISNQEAMEAIGKHVGRIVYLLDSYLDLKEDLHRNNFNPLVNQFGLSDALNSGEIRRIQKYCVRLLNESLKNINLGLRKVKFKAYQKIIDEILINGLSKKISAVFSEGLSRKKLTLMPSMLFFALNQNNDACTECGTEMERNPCGIPGMACFTVFIVVCIIAACRWAKDTCESW